MAKQFLPIRQEWRYAHDADGNMFKVLIQIDKKGKEQEAEEYRKDLHQRMIWVGMTADLGIRQFKKQLSPNMKKRDRKFLIDGYKTNVWQQDVMKSHISATARV